MYVLVCLFFPRRVERVAAAACLLGDAHVTSRFQWMAETMNWAVFVIAIIEI